MINVFETILNVLGLLFWGSLILVFALILLGPEESEREVRDRRVPKSPEQNADPE